MQEVAIARTTKLPGFAAVRGAIAFATLMTTGMCAMPVHAQISPITSCDNAGVGSATLIGDGPPVTIASVSTGTAGSGASAVPYCLVKLLVPQAINIWVALPTGGKWNGRLQSEGGGGYAGAVGVATGSVLGGYVGVQTDTGHTGGSGTFGCIGDCAGNSAANPGQPDIARQTDFAYRSEHLMAVLGKQLAQAFYGQQPMFSYWNGCSTGGRQGLRIAQDFPGDYNGILAGAPAIHWDRFQAYQIWPQVVMFRDLGYTLSTAKENLATNQAVAACDLIDGVQDSVLTDPRKCTYNPVLDAAITRASCTQTDNTCLSPAEAGAILKIWNGATNARGKQLWFGLERGTPLNSLAGANPFAIAVAQPRFWVYFDPTWDWHVLNYANFEMFFRQTMLNVNPLMGSENPNLSAFRTRGGKLISWHGFADPLIMPEGTIFYYNSVVSAMSGGSYADTQQFYRLFMAPGVNHCGGGAAPQPQGLFQAVVDWVENGTVPATIPAVQNLTGGVTRNRPLCPYPAFATYVGGDPNSASSFVCANQ